MFIALLFATAADAESFQETMEKAKSGDAEAQGQLGLIYQDGRGVPQDFIQAHAWFNVAGARGNVDAAISRDELAKRMTPEQSARAQQLAAEYFQRYDRDVLPAASRPSEPIAQPEPKAATPDYARSGPYVGMGLAIASFTEAEEADEKELLFLLGYAVDVSYDTGVGLDLVAGYRFHPHIAAQVHLQYLPDTAVTVDGIEFLNLNVLTFTADLKGYLLTGRIQPYGLVGVGFMYLDLEETDFFFAVDFTDFAARLGGGVDYYFTENLVFNAEIGGVLPTGTLEDLDQFTFSAGLQYRF
jgi:opacity protein-like surface antigen